MRVLCLVFLANQFTTALSWNLDSEVTSFVTTYLPAKHKPILLRDLVFTFADLYNIIEVNEKEETITTKLWMYVGYAVEVGVTAWNDSGLVDVLEIFPGFDKVWLPDVIVLNSVKIIDTTFKDPVVQQLTSCDEETGCVIEDGYVLVVFPFARTQKTACSFDASDFPFDTQYCFLELGPWFTDFTTFPRSIYGAVGPYYIGHPNSDVASMSLLSYQQNSQWQLVSAKMTNSTRSASHGTVIKEFNTIVYTLELKRKPEFYVYSLVVPSAILTVLVVLSIFLPVASGEKLGLAVTLLLAQVVNLMILSGLIPTNSQNFPELGYYFLLTIILISVSLIYNVIIISIYHYQHKSIFRKFITQLKAFKPRPKVAAVEENSSFDNDALKHEDSSSDETSRNEGDKANLESSVLALIQILIEQRKSGDEFGEQRKKICVVSDHIFGVFLLLAIFIVHMVFFVPYF